MFNFSDNVKHIKVNISDQSKKKKTLFFSLKANNYTTCDKTWSTFVSIMGKYATVYTGILSQGHGECKKKKIQPTFHHLL